MAVGCLCGVGMRGGDFLRCFSLMSVAENMYERKCMLEIGRTNMK